MFIQPDFFPATNDPNAYYFMLSGREQRFKELYARQGQAVGHVVYHPKLNNIPEFSKKVENLIHFADVEPNENAVAAIGNMESYNWSTKR